METVEFTGRFECKKHRCTYVHLIEFILDDLHYLMCKLGTEDIEWRYIDFLYNLNKGRVRIALSWHCGSMLGLIELQLHEKLSA